MSNQIRYAQVLLTYPQCKATKERLLEVIKSWNAECAVVCHEDHHETEGEHLHAWVKFSSSQRTRSWATLFDFDGYHGNYQKVTISARSIRDTVKYVTKDGDYLVWNCDVKVLTSDNKAHARKYNNEVFIKSKLEDLVDEGMINIKDYCAYQRSINAYKLSKPSQHTLKCKGIWLWGDAGVGKTKWAEQFGEYCGGYYEKGPSKYWDGYEGQEVIIMDEARSAALFDAGYITKWADNSPCKAEVKGSTIWLRHKYFIITSNKNPRDFCVDKSGYQDPVLFEAVSRRFFIREVRKCNLPEDHPYLDFSPDDVFDNPWCTLKDVLRGSIEKEDVSSSRDAAEPCSSQAADVSQSAAPIEPSSPPASKIAPSSDFANPFGF